MVIFKIVHERGKFSDHFVNVVHEWKLAELKEGESEKYL
jgi:hypothetical protein